MHSLNRMTEVSGKSGFGSGQGRAQKLSGYRNLAILFALTIFTLACTGTGNAAGGSADRPNPVLHSVKLVSGSTSVLAEVAQNEEQRTRGLMFRKSLADGKGMLFVFETDQRPAFWMKNTQIPLSLAYIASDGTITQILDLVPFSTEARPSERLVRYALEVPQGWFAKAGLKAGDHFAIPSLD